MEATNETYWVPMLENQTQIVKDIIAERLRQEKLRDEGRFKFTAADMSLTHAERLPMLTEELGEIARQIQQQPDSGLMPVTHAGNFDAYRAAGRGPKREGADPAFDPEQGTRPGLRKELVQLAAIAVAWIEALDIEGGSTGHLPHDAPASRPAWQPQSAPAETGPTEAG